MFSDSQYLNVYFTVILDTLYLFKLGEDKTYYNLESGNTGLKIYELWDYIRKHKAQKFQLLEKDFEVNIITTNTTAQSVKVQFIPTKYICNAPPLDRNA